MMKTQSKASKASPKSEPKPMAAIAAVAAIADKSESERVFFSYHASHGTTEGETYVYLLHNEVFDRKRGKALANQAIVAWWLPYARREQHTHEHARETAIDCIEQMEQHIAKLRRDFQIPPATLPSQPPYQVMTVLPVATSSATVSQPQVNRQRKSRQSR